jgi:transglutaminase-like putative cysteine protease
MTRYAVTHTTTYTYSAAATSSRSLAHLRPRETPRQRVLSHDLEIAPAPTSLSARADYFGNTQHALEVALPHSQLTIVSRSEVELDGLPPLSHELSPTWESSRAPQALGDDERQEAAQFALESPLVPLGGAYAAIAAPFFTPGRPILAAALAFNAHLHRQFEYRAGATDVTTPVDEVIANGRGVCQDFAHVALACLRSLGLPARYVSGYLRTSRRDDLEPHLVGADASHAWISLRCGELGWIDLDPTNDCLAGASHITVAYGRDFSDVTPVKGVLVGRGSGQEVAVAVLVRQIAHA